MTNGKPYNCTSTILMATKLIKMLIKVSVPHQVSHRLFTSKCLSQCCNSSLSIIVFIKIDTFFVDVIKCFCYRCLLLLSTSLHSWNNFHFVSSFTFNPSRPDPGQREKLNLNFYFHTSLWCLKRLYEGLKDLHKTFEAP